MAKKHIKINFIDHHGGKPEVGLYLEILRDLYDVEISSRPDYVFDGGIGREYVNYDYGCVKIVTIGESYAPDFNFFDYAIGFDDLSFGDRYLRMPLFAFYPEFRQFARPPITDPERFLKRDFCSFVVSNDDGDPARVEFFKRLSKYKQVASGGKLFNNVGGRVPDKNAFLAKYKFNIAFENSCVPGYTTEKILEPLAIPSVPIYYGNPTIAKDFDPACMVHVATRADMDRAIEEIIALDKDDARYLEKLAAPAARFTYEECRSRLTEFLRNIFDQPLEEARRTCEYGYQVNIRRRQKRLFKMYEMTTPARLVKRIRAKLRGKSSDDVLDTFTKIAL